MKYHTQTTVAGSFFCYHISPTTSNSLVLWLTCPIAKKFLSFSWEQGIEIISSLFLHRSAFCKPVATYLIHLHFLNQNLRLYPYNAYSTWACFSTVFSDKNAFTSSCVKKSAAGFGTAVQLKVWNVCLCVCIYTCPCLLKQPFKYKTVCVIYISAWSSRVIAVQLKKREREKEIQVL